MSCGGGSRAWSHAGGVRGRWCTRGTVCIHCWELPLQRRGWERSAGSSQDERPPQETGRGRSHCEPHPQSGSACRLPSVPRQPPAECRPPQPQVGPPPAPQPALTAHSTQHRVQSTEYRAQSTVLAALQISLNTKVPSHCAGVLLHTVPFPHSLCQLVLVGVVWAAGEAALEACTLVPEAAVSTG